GRGGRRGRRGGSDREGRRARIRLHGRANPMYPRPATTSRPRRAWRPWSRESIDLPDHAVGVRATRDRRWASAHSVTAETWRPRKTDNTSVAAVWPPLKPVAPSDILQPGVDFLFCLVPLVTLKLSE